MMWHELMLTSLVWLRRRNWARVEGEHHTGALLGLGAAGAWDAAGCARARALVAAQRDLRMFYASPDGTTGAWAIGLARSADGLAWKKAGTANAHASCRCQPCEHHC